MACQNNCGGNQTPQQPSCGCNNANYLIIIVLYILLAIILGSFIVC